MGSISMSVFKANRWENTSGIQYDMITQCQTLQTSSRTSWSAPVDTQTIIAPLSITITPREINSKIIVHWMINGEVHHDTLFRIFRNGAEAPNGRNAEAPISRWSGYSAGIYDMNQATTPASWNLLYIDTPNSSLPQIYQVAVGSAGATAHTFFLNRTFETAGSDARELMVSAAVAWEIYQ